MGEKWVRTSQESLVANCFCQSLTSVMMIVLVESRTNSTVEKRQGEKGALASRRKELHNQMTTVAQLTIVRVGGTCYMNKRIVEIIIDQTVFEFLNEIKDSVVKIFRRSWIICKWFLFRYITV